MNLPVLGEEKHDQRSIIHLKQLSGALRLSAQEQWSIVTNRSVIHCQHAQMRQAHRGHHEKCLLSILWLFTIEPSNYYRWNQFSPGWSLRSVKVVCSAAFLHCKHAHSDLIHLKSRWYVLRKLKENYNAMLPGKRLNSNPVALQVCASHGRAVGLSGTFGGPQTVRLTSLL